MTRTDHVLPAGDTISRIAYLMPEKRIPTDDEIWG
jgi:hypothetical protein